MQRTKTLSSQQSRWSPHRHRPCRLETVTPKPIRCPRNSRTCCPKSCQNQDILGTLLLARYPSQLAAFSNVQELSNVAGVIDPVAGTPDLCRYCTPSTRWALFPNRVAYRGNAARRPRAMSTSAPSPNASATMPQVVIPGTGTAAATMTSNAPMSKAELGTGRAKLIGGRCAGGISSVDGQAAGRVEPLPPEMKAKMSRDAPDHEGEDLHATSRPGTNGMPRSVVSRTVPATR